VEVQLVRLKARAGHASGCHPKITSKRGRQPSRDPDSCRCPLDINVTGGNDGVGKHLVHQLLPTDEITSTGEHALPSLPPHRCRLELMRKPGQMIRPAGQNAEPDGEFDVFA
jgi:hypothetical protein